MNVSPRMVRVKKRVGSTTPLSSKNQTKRVLNNSAPSSSTTSQPESFINGPQSSNGIQLNGVWKDYYDVIVSANEKEKLSEEIIAFLCEERDSFSYERALLIEHTNQNLSSLTQVETKHLRGLQIIDHVRTEKEGLEKRCHALEAQRDWLEQQRLQLRHQEDHQNQVIATLETKMSELERVIAVEKRENESLLEITYRRDEMIESLEKKILRQDEATAVLRKSLSTKDRQFQVLLKERNRLRAELDVLEKEVRRWRRFPNRADEEESGLQAPPVPIEIGPTFPHFQRRLAVPNPTTPGTECDETDDDEVFDSFTAGSPGGLSMSSSSLTHRPTSPGTPQVPAPVATPKAKRAVDCSSSGSGVTTGCTTTPSLQPGGHHDSPASILANDMSTFLLIHDHTAGNVSSTVDTKDKIYRSAIKKLQRELQTARSEIKELHEQLPASKRNGLVLSGGVGTARKLFATAPSPRKLF